MRTAMAVALTVLLAAAAVSNPTRDPSFQHPVIKGHGGIVLLPGTAHPPKPDSKVVLDITSDELSGKILKGFDRAALMLNLYSQAGAGTDNGLKMAIILHGPATKAALSDDAFAKHSQPYAKNQGATKNPNLDVIRELTEAGVEVFVCGQALAHHGYGTDEVADEVSVAVSAATANINLQTDGYAYIPFHS